MQIVHVRRCTKDVAEVPTLLHIFFLQPRVFRRMCQFELMLLYDQNARTLTTSRTEAQRLQSCSQLCWSLFLRHFLFHDPGDGCDNLIIPMKDGDIG